jgi:hypothetical protein
MNKQMRFVVMGDTHYVQPEVHRRALNGRPHGVTEVADITRNYWMTQNVLPETISQISRLQPDFIIQTGDIIQGHCDDEEGCLREMREALDLLDGLNAPMFFALGTHDGIPGQPGGQAVEHVVYPSIGKTLGRAVGKGYYSFEKEGSLFIVLDYTTFVRNDGQAHFIKETFQRAGEYEHVFVFGHPPLIPVGRPFFTKFDFVNEVLAQLSNVAVDAYFCGHTHNQISTLHQVGNQWLTHLKSTVLGYPNEAPVSLTDVRPLLPDPDSFEFGWGFLEDSAPGWWLITVDGAEVQADWHVLHQGVVGQLKWRKGEKAVFTKRPDFTAAFGSPLPKPEEIVSVRLRAAGDNCRAPEAYRVALNGTDIGTLPRLEYFDCRQLMEIPQEHWHLLSDVNLIEVTTGADDLMTIGGIVLEVEKKTGWVRSSVSDYFTCSNRWDRWGKHPLISIVPGAVVTIELRFGGEAC